MKTNLNLMRWTFLLLLWTGAPRVYGAVDMFLKISGTTVVMGESQDPRHKDEIDLLAWSWGMSNSSRPQGGGGGAGKVSVQDLSLTKWVDRSTPALMEAVASGRHFNEAVLIVRRPGNNPVEFLKITMKEVLVTSVATGAGTGDDRLKESVSLNFAEVEVEYVPVDEKGKPETAIPFRWDIAGNSGG